MKVTFNAVFNRKNKLNKFGKAPIEIRAYQNGTRKFSTTKIFITPQQWDERKCEIKKHPQASQLNSQIDSLISDLEQKQLESIVNKKSFSINTLKAKDKSSYNGSFLAFMREEIKNNLSITLLTKRSHTNTINKLQAFRGTDEISFEEIDYSFVDDFLNHLRKKNHALNTIHKQYKNLKKYIEVAIKKGYYHKKNPCKDISVQTESKKREILTIEEMRLIEKLDLKKLDEKLTVIRDMFLFACYTGLRISDVTNLKTSFVKKEKEGYALDFVTIKVNKRAEIPLYSLFRLQNSKLTRPEMILEKYYNEKSEFVFPKLSEPYINRQLKLIASMTEIPVKITFHTARHSFGTYMAAKIPLPQLLYLMQHSDVKTTMMYVNTSQQLVKQGLMKVDWEE